MAREMGNPVKAGKVCPFAETSFPAGEEMAAAGGGFAKSNANEELPPAARIWLRATAPLAWFSFVIRSAVASRLAMGAASADVATRSPKTALRSMVDRQKSVDDDFDI